jgi:hypothetical protein
MYYHYDISISKQMGLKGVGDSIAFLVWWKKYTVIFNVLITLLVVVIIEFFQL